MEFVHEGLFVTYLYVYVYDNISNDNNSKFPKSPNPRFWEWRGIGTDCPVIAYFA